MVTITGRTRLSSETIGLLMDKADIQGYLVTDDIRDALPDDQQTEECVQTALAALRRRGVTFFDGCSTECMADDLYGEEAYPTETFVNISAISSDDTVGMYLREISRVPLLSYKRKLLWLSALSAARQQRKIWRRSVTLSSTRGGKRWNGWWKTGKMPAGT